MENEDRALIMTDLIRAKECLKKYLKKVPANEVQELDSKAEIEQCRHRISYLTKMLSEGGEINEKGTSEPDGNVS